jgi:hypothetical protein
LYFKFSRSVCLFTFHHIRTVARTVPFFSDKEGKETFRAANYGLTDEEKESLQQYKTKLAQQQKIANQQQESQKTSPKETETG